MTFERNSSSITWSEMEKQNIQAKEVYLGAALLQLYDSVLNLHGKNNEIRKNKFTQPQSIKFGL